MLQYQYWGNLGGHKSGCFIKRSWGKPSKGLPESRTSFQFLAFFWGNRGLATISGGNAIISGGNATISVGNATISGGNGGLATISGGNGGFATISGFLIFWELRSSI